MVVTLIAIIFLNLAIIAYLFQKNSIAKRQHLKKSEALQSIIAELLNSQQNQNEKIQLANEIKEKLKISQSKLNNDILALQFEFLDILTENNLLR